MKLFHYTTINGLIGIISNQELWASECRYLNDGSELEYANNIFLEEVKNLNLNFDQFKNVGGYYRLPYNILDRFQMFVTCFCKKGDLLSQWRGYGNDLGYSLGFEKKDLKKMSDLIPIQYGIKQPKEFFENDLSDAQTITAHPGNWGVNYSPLFLYKIAQIKNPLFQEEQEWRLMFHIDKYNTLKNPRQIRFRPSNLGPIPYFSNKFPLKALKEVIIGPGINIKAREETVRNLLDYYGFTEVKVTLSEIPYRT